MMNFLLEGADHPNAPNLDVLSELQNNGVLLSITCNSEQQISWVSTGHENFGDDYSSVTGSDFDPATHI